jgi:hypothetical protein
VRAEECLHCETVTVMHSYLEPSHLRPGPRTLAPGHVTSQQTALSTSLHLQRPSTLSSTRPDTRDAARPTSDHVLEDCKVKIRFAFPFCLFPFVSYLAVSRAYVLT